MKSGTRGGAMGNYKNFAGAKKALRELTEREAQSRKTGEPETLTIEVWPYPTGNTLPSNTVAHREITAAVMAAAAAGRAMRGELTEAVVGGQRYCVRVGG